MDSDRGAGADLTVGIEERETAAASRGPESGAAASRGRARRRGREREGPRDEREEQSRAGYRKHVPTILRITARLLLPVSLLAALAGCGSSSHRTSRAAGSGTPITQAQALILARLLELDRVRGGSRLQGALTLGTQAIDFSGSVDFAGGRGELRLHQRGLGPQAARRFYWTARMVLAQAKPTGNGRGRYDVEAPDPVHDPVHALIQLIQLLSAATIDNLEALETKGILFLGRRVSGGRPLDVYRYGQRGSATFWVDPSTGLLDRVDAVLSGGAGSATVELETHAPIRIALPPRSRWITG